MKKVVLLADDDRDDAEIFQEALADADCDADFFRVDNGIEVLDFLENENNPIPDVIFLDLNMPLMNGWQCLDTIRNKKEFEKLPVIMYSTSSNPRDQELGRDLKADGFITKPSDPNVLARVLNLIICSIGTDNFEQSVQAAYFISKAIKS
jgi:CheY-like chemotaxis protein